jgi:hypothetical protein
MSQSLTHQETRGSLTKHLLFDLLSNPLILRNTTPYLSSFDRLALASVAHDFRDLINNTPGVFRHLDLVHVAAAQKANFALDPRPEVRDSDLTDEEYVNGEGRGGRWQMGAKRNDPYPEENPNDKH